MKAKIRHLQQVAALWQTDRAKLDKSAINVQHYSQTHAQNGILGPSYGGSRSNISTLFESCNAKKLCSRVSSRKCQFYSQNSKFVSEHLWATFLWGLTGNVCDSFLWKADSRLSIGYNWTFLASSYSWCTNMSKAAFVEGGRSLLVKY